MNQKLIDKKKFAFKNDKYKKARDGYSRFLTIYCAKCKSPVCLYQKDGHQYLLKRMYLDRILAPNQLTNLQNTDAKSIICTDCHALIGKRYTYEKENREAFLLQTDSFIKKVTKGIF